MWVTQGLRPHTRVLFTDHIQPERGDTTVALFCDKAAPTIRLSEYFDHNLCGTFNGAEVMSWCGTKAVEQNEGGSVKTRNPAPVTSENNGRTQHPNKTTTFSVEDAVLFQTTIWNVRNNRRKISHGESLEAENPVNLSFCTQIRSYEWIETNNNMLWNWSDF